MKLMIPLLCCIFSIDAFAKTIEEWVDSEFTPSTLSKKDQIKELNWFQTASKPFRGMHIIVISEKIDTHLYEANVLAKAFYDITGIKVTHEITGEDNLIKKIQVQMNIGQNLYDGFINDSDLIGTHYRSNKVQSITSLMSDTAKDVTNPMIDLNDFIGLKFTTGPDKIVYQLPDQQFANLYWYRADWFARKDLRDKFKKIYGYNLDVPVNWTAYENIAEFFTVHVKEIDGQRVYGHMDYGANDPSLGWRFSDAWLSMAGAGDKGLPNGLPVDDWGVRMEGCHPVGASIERGGATNSPAAVYAIEKFLKWLKLYAPPAAYSMTFSQAGPIPSQGNIAQQIFWYTAFTASMSKKGLAVVNDDGTPKWKMAPSPHGAYWEKGMKLGYQDVGSWTFLKSTPPDRLKAAWLYAQFVTSKSVSLKKTIVGLTPIRKSDIFSEEMGKRAKKLGGFVEFYRSMAREMWTPTGVNIADYPLMSEGWWKVIPQAVEGKMTPNEAMDALANYLDKKMEKLSKKKIKCAPILNKKSDPKIWLDKVGAPKNKLNNEMPPGITLPWGEVLKVYDEK